MHVEMHLYVIMMMMLDDLHMKVVIKNVKLFQLMVHFLVNPVLYRVDQGKKTNSLWSNEDEFHWYLFFY